jgi:hypothetical protein
MVFGVDNVQPQQLFQVLHHLLQQHLSVLLHLQHLLRHLTD